MSKKTPEQTLAEQVGEWMYGRDKASQELGIILDTIEPGYARMHMQVRANMLNGHHICHGGFIFSLADSAFAFSCNSYNQNTVAAGVVIDFLSPAQLDDTLSAEAKEQTLSGRTGVYDVVVTNQEGVKIALFRGRSRSIRGSVLPESQEQ